MAAAEPILVDDGTDRERWKEARRTGIGSSDAAGILGVAPRFFPNAFELALLKRGLNTRDEREQEANELLSWGHRLEQPMLDAFLDETGFEGGLQGKLWRAPEDDASFMIATPDGWIRDASGTIGGVECKLKVYQTQTWEIDGVPDHVQTQVQHQARVMGWSFIYVLVLLEGYRLRWVRIERDDDVLGETIIPAEARWWDDFLNDRPMDPFQGSPDATARALKRLYPEDSGETISLTGHRYLKLLERMKRAREAEKRWKAERERCANALKAAIGDATWAELDDGTTLSLKTTRRDETIQRATSFRSLRIVGEGR